MGFGASCRALVFRGLLMGLPVLAGAQAPAPAPPAAAPAAEDPMLRARRDAANPMRRILEAASIERTRLRSRDRDAPAADGLRALPAAAPVEPSLKPASPPETVSPPDTGIRVTIEPLPAAVADAPRPPTSAPADPVATTAASAAPTTATVPVPVQVQVPTPVPKLVPEPVELPAGLPVVRLTDAPPPAPRVGKPPVLVSMVEPSIPPRLLDRLRPDETIGVRLTVGADGRVRDVDVDASVSRTLVPYVRDALRQWQFDAGEDDRSHRVELVFK